MFNESQKSIIDSITAISRQRDDACRERDAAVDALRPVQITASRVPGLTATLDEVTCERDELREAARAFLDAFANQAARCALCEKEGKREPITLREGAYMACDAHGRELLEAPADLSYAPALRRLRSLLAG